MQCPIGSSMAAVGDIATGGGHLFAGRGNGARLSRHLLGAAGHLRRSGVELGRGRGDTLTVARHHGDYLPQLATGFVHLCGQHPHLVAAGDVGTGRQVPRRHFLEGPEHRLQRPGYRIGDEVAGKECTNHYHNNGEQEYYP